MYTRFEGWKSDAEFLREEEEQKRRDEQTIRRMVATRHSIVRGKELLWFFVKVVFWAAVVAAFVIGWLAL